MRIALGIEYDGSCYHGWQRQPELETVQGYVEHALSQIAAHPVSVVCAGRTDTGVHAVGQIVHFDTHSQRNERAWLLGTNSHLPNAITVRWVKEVTVDFNARFSALARRYCYLIYNGPVRPAIGRTTLTWQYRSLDEQKMNLAAQYLVGEHDFTSYRALECQAKNPVRNLWDISVKRYGPVIAVEVAANAFLHHMVRNIVGVLIDIGIGLQEPIWAKEVLEAKDRSLGGVTAPPYGLYFVGAVYPDEFGIPQANSTPFFIHF